MKLIAHRGLYNGPNKNIENDPNQVQKALDLGFDAEIDLWALYGNLYLGHDEPQYRIDKSFLENTRLWIHAKNLDALLYLTETDLNYFWHQDDDYVITSKHWIWTYPGKTLTKRSVMVMPEWKDPGLKNIKLDCYGICSDYVYNIKTTFSI